MKTKTLDSQNTNLKAPGPGAYKLLPLLSDKGFNFLSKYSSSKASIWNPACSKKFS